MTKKPFGVLPSGEQAYTYSISCGQLQAEISDFGVIFAPGSAYTSDSNFTIEALDSDRYITLNADEETNDLLASFMGITTSKQVTRVVRAYATTDSGNMYSNVYSHTFN